MDNLDMLENPKSIIKSRSKISAVWLVPLVAIIFGGYLAIKAYMAMGVMISLNVPDMVGIIAGKTEVKYKGLVVGRVEKGVTLSDDLNTIELQISMIAQAEHYLNKQTLFWLVKPEITLGGVAGLDTLLSGNYIAIRPGKDTSLTQQLAFTLLNDTPSSAPDTPGLHLTLTSNELGSINIGSQIFHHQVPVGKVNSYQINKQNKVEIGVLVMPQFSHLVNQNSRFWNTSGIAIEAGVSGFRVDIGSIAALIGGGISFDTPQYLDDGDPVKNLTQFSLYPDHKSAAVTITATLIFPSDAKVKKSTTVMVNGFEVGQIKEFRLDHQNKEFVTQVEFDPRMQPMLNDDTVFFMVSPQVSLAGIANLETAIIGQYVSFMPGSSAISQDTFHVALSPPPLNNDYPGLHLTLTAPEIGSLSYGDPVKYKGVTVGDIQQINMPTNADEFTLKLHIRPEHAHLVTEQSSFWNAGGLKISGSATGFEWQIDSVESLLVGGIAFSNSRAEETSSAAIKNGAKFTLFADHLSSLYTHTFTVEFHYSSDVSQGLTNIMLANKVIGKVTKIDTDYRKNKLIATLRVKQNMAWLLNTDTRFWLVKPRLTSASLGQLVNGAYIHVGPGFSAKSQHKFIAEKSAQPEPISAGGLQLKLTAGDKTAITLGASVFHRNIAIGYVSAVTLNNNSNTTELAVTIDQAYQNLISRGSRFYDASGLDVQINLRGVSIRTESLSSVIAGGIGLYQSDQDAEPVDENTHFSLYPSYRQAQHAGISIKIHFASAQGLFEGMAIKYQQQEIGIVKRVVFNAGLKGVMLEAQLYKVAQHLATTEASIWQVMPSFGLVGNKNLQALYSPYLAMTGGETEGDAATEFVAVERQPTVKSLATGLNIRLTAKKLGSVRSADPVLFRQVKVGQVIGTELNPATQEVSIYINIENKYSGLVSLKSVFWNASGIQVNAGLFSGLNLTTQSIETLLAGGIAFANPPQVVLPSKMAEQMAEKLTFILEHTINNEWLDW